LYLSLAQAYSNICCFFFSRKIVIMARLLSLASLTGVGATAPEFTLYFGNK
jgi:hypothetical protein